MTTGDENDDLLEELNQLGGTWNETEASAGFDEVPAGQYRLQVSKAKLDRTKGNATTPATPCIKWDFVVTDGDHEGRHHFMTQVLSTKGLPHVKRFLADLGRPVEGVKKLGAELQETLEALLDQEFLASITDGKPGEDGRKFRYTKVVTLLDEPEAAAIEELKGRIGSGKPPAKPPVKTAPAPAPDDPIAKACAVQKAAAAKVQVQLEEQARAQGSKAAAANKPPPPRPAPRTATEVRVIEESFLPEEPEPQTLEEAEAALEAAAKAEQAAIQRVKDKARPRGPKPAPSKPPEDDMFGDLDEAGAEA